MAPSHQTFPHESRYQCLDCHWAQVEGSAPRKAGERLAASYVNFYLPNGGAVIPQFGGEAAEADARHVSDLPVNVPPLSAVVAMQHAAISSFLSILCYSAIVHLCNWLGAALTFMIPMSFLGCQASFMMF